AQPVPDALLRMTDVIVCNEHELGVMLGEAVTPGEEAVAARAVRGTSEQLIVVTLGERGALAVVGDHSFEQSAFRVSSIDTTGAGDAFVAGFVNSQWWLAG